MCFNTIEKRQLQQIVDLRPGQSLIVDQPTGEALAIKLKVHNFVHTMLYIKLACLVDEKIDLEKLALNDPNGLHYAVIEFQDHDPNFFEVVKMLQYFGTRYEINYLKNLLNRYTIDLSQLDVYLPKLYHHSIHDV